MNRAELAEISRTNAALARAARTEISNERFERFIQLRRGGFTIQEAAWELRISRRHADRYEARRRQQSSRVNGNR